MIGKFFKKNFFDKLIYLGLSGLLISIPFEEADVIYKISLICLFIGATAKSFIKTPVRFKLNALTNTFILFVLGLLVFSTIRYFSPIIQNSAKMEGYTNSILQVVWHFIKTPVFLVFSFFLIYDDFRVSLVEGKDFSQTKILRLLLKIMFVLFTLSCFASIFPILSFKFFWREMGIYLWITLVVWKEISDFEGIKRIILLCSIIAFIVGFIGVAELFVYKLGGPGTKDFMQKNKWIKAEKYTHIQFPMGHHNRMASYCMMGTILALFYMHLIQNIFSKMKVLILLLFPFLAMVLTLNRGAIIAFIFAYILMVILTKPARIIILPIVLLLVFILLPPESKERLTSIFKKETYTSQEGSFHFRKVAWISTINIIKDHPALGIGYYFRNYEHVYQFYSNNDVEEKTHCHNNFLQVAVESGIINSLVFIFWIINLYIGLINRWRNLKGLENIKIYSIGFISLLTGIMIFGLTNYSLRYNIGAFIFILFGMMLAYLKLSEQAAVKLKNISHPE